jgi:hypothetical protein
MRVEDYLVYALNTVATPSLFVYITHNGLTDFP